MCHAANSNELLEVFGDELGAVVGDDARCGIGIFFLGAQQNHFDFGLGHGRTNFPVHDGATEAVQHAAQVIKCAANVYIEPAPDSFYCLPYRRYGSVAFLWIANFAGMNKKCVL